MIAVLMGVILSSPAAHKQFNLSKVLSASLKTLVC